MTLKGTPIGTGFTVIVPTRERADTLVHCLRTLTTQDYANLRILVSDNCSNDDTRAVVESVDDPRIMYVNPGRRLSMAHHWEYALSHVSDGWVMFVGDDDGLCPGAIGQLNELISQSSVEAITAAYSVFVWPGHMRSHPTGKLVVPLGRGAAVRSTKHELRRALAGEIPYSNLPWLYNGGTASIRAINAARGADGRFFRAQTPDLYSAVALSLSLDRYLSVATPIAVGGTSRHSTGASTVHTNSQDEKGAALRYASEDNIPFHKDLILGKSVDIVLYECYLQARHLHVPGFEVTIGKQLQFAVDSTTSNLRSQTLDECRRMAEMHGTPPPTPRAGLRFRLSRLVSSLRRVMNRYSVDPGRLGIRDVFGAAQATTAIHATATKRPLFRLLTIPRELVLVLFARRARSAR